MANEAIVTSQSGALRPANLGEAIEFARIIANSDLVPKDYRGKPGNVLIAVQMGAELGLAPMQSVQNIAVINGRPSVWGDALLAIVLAQPDCEDVQETEDPGKSATCTVVRRGRKPVVRTFSVDDAKRAKLWGKQGPWTDYPQRMLQMRARSWACRDSYADALRGLHSAEEVLDIPGEVTVTRARTQPERVPAAEPKALPSESVPSEPDLAPALTESLIAELVKRSEPGALKDWADGVMKLPKEDRAPLWAAFGDHCKRLNLDPGKTARGEAVAP